MKAPIKNPFSKSLFWDSDEADMDLEKHARFIIGRVLMRGLMQDWWALKEIYGLERIKQEAMKIRYLDKLTLNFCSKLFNVPKSKFRSYNQPKQVQQLWDF